MVGKIFLVLLMWTPDSGMIERVYEQTPYESRFECWTRANERVWEFLREEGMSLNDLQGIKDLCLTAEELDDWYERRST